MYFKALFIYSAVSKSAQYCALQLFGVLSHTKQQMSYVFTIIVSNQIIFYSCKENGKDAKNSPKIVTLTDEKTYYFTCGFGTHCKEFKQKLQVLVTDNCNSEEAEKFLKHGM